MQSSIVSRNFPAMVSAWISLKNSATARCILITWCVLMTTLLFILHFQPGFILNDFKIDSPGTEKQFYYSPIPTVVRKDLPKPAVKPPEFSNVDKPGNTTLPFKTLIISYARSGSTMLGQLVAKYPGSVYIVEPLQILKRLTKSTYCEPFVKHEVDVMDNVFNCELGNIQKFVGRKNWWDAHIKKHLGKVNGRNCPKLQQLMVKEILFRSTKRALKWLSDRKDIRVIHLVRDPRGVWNSRKKGNEMLKWPTSIEAMCYPILVDLEELPAALGQRYYRIRYEDFLADPVAMLSKLYDHAGLPKLSEQQVEEIVGEYIITDGSPAAKSMPKPSYYSIKRMKSQIEVDKWKKGLSNTELDQVETTCAKVLEILDYPCR